MIARPDFVSVDPADSTSNDAENSSSPDPEPPDPSEPRYQPTSTVTDTYGSGSDPRLNPDNYQGGEVVSESGSAGDDIAADIISPDPNESSDGDAVSIGDDGSVTVDPSLNQSGQSVREQIDTAVDVLTPSPSSDSPQNSPVPQVGDVNVPGVGAVSGLVVAAVVGFVAWMVS